MVTSDKVSGVYAEALMELAKADSSYELVGEELREITAALTRDAGVWKFFKSPLVPSDEKQKLIDKHLKDKLSKTVYNFLGVISVRKRFEDLPGINNAYAELLDDVLRRKRVKVSTSIDLTSEQKEQLTAALKTYFNKSIILEIENKPDLIGGMVIRSGDMLIDTSITSRLQIVKNRLLKKRILGEGYYEN